MEHEGGKRLRKKPKRFITSDEEDDQEPTVAPRTRRLSTVSSEAEQLHEEEVDVVDAETYDEPPTPEPVSKAKGGATSRTKAKRRMTDEVPTPAPKKKARRVVASEDEDDDGDFYAAIAEDIPEPDYEDEDEYEPEEKPTPRIKSSTKGKASASTAKGKKREKGADSMDTAADGHSRKRARPLRQNHSENLSVDVIGDGDDSSHVDSRAPSVQGSTPNVPAKRESPAPTTSTKRGKLPPIKKTKQPGSTTSGAASALGAAKKSLDALPGSVKPSQDDLRKNMIEATDLDLSNKSVYDELFKGTSGGAPRPGIARKTREEERRKELMRLKDQYVAKLAEEAAKTFDLQSEMDRISRYEEGLRARQSSAVFPNFLAAKWREHWERGKRRQQRDQQAQNPDPAPPKNHVAEEGEVE